MMHLTENIADAVCIAPVNLAVASVIGTAIDRKGYGGVTFLVGYGAISASTTTVTTTVMESDLSTASTFTSVADGDLVGTEALVSVGAVAKVAGSTSALFKKVGYKGSKRYVKVKMKANVSTIGGAVAVLFNPALVPIAQP